MKDVMWLIKDSVLFYLIYIIIDVMSEELLPIAFNIIITLLLFISFKIIFDFDK